MNGCGDNQSGEPRSAASSKCCSGSTPPVASAACDPKSWFARMLDNCYAYATQAKAAGRPIVGILCEFTPRELIMAAGAVPVCLCGGSLETIAAAEEHLPANLCPLIKSTFGYHVLGRNPFLEMADLVVAETTCNGKKKMYELMAESRPVYVLELPQKPDDPDAMGHWGRELAKFRAVLEARFRVSVTDCRLRQAIGLMNRERALRRQLAELMQSDRPPLSGRELLRFKSSISGIPADLEQFERALREFRSGSFQPSDPATVPESCPSCPGGDEAMKAVQCSASQTTTRSVGPQEGLRGCEHGTVPFGCTDPQRGEELAAGTGRPAGAVRVLMTGVPMAHGAERVLEIIEQNGGLVVCQENCTGVKPILEDVDETAVDPLRAIAEKYFHLPCSVMTRNDRRLDVLRRLVREYRPECVVELIWQACLTYDVESNRVKRLVEKELGLPYLRIETDYSPSDSARIAVRVEALMEMVRAKEASTLRGG